MTAVPGAGQARPVPPDRLADLETLVHLDRLDNPASPSLRPASKSRSHPANPAPEASPVNQDHPAPPASLVSLDSPETQEAKLHLASPVRPGLPANLEPLANLAALDNLANQRSRKKPDQLLLALQERQELPASQETQARLVNQAAQASPARRDHPAHLDSPETTDSPASLASPDSPEAPARRAFAPNTAQSTGASSSRTALADDRRVSFEGRHVDAEHPCWPGNELIGAIAAAPLLLLLVSTCQKTAICQLKLFPHPN